MMGETYLTVMRWFKGFNPWKTEVTSTLVWVQLPELPIEFINKEAAMKIGKLIGNPTRVDRATEEGARGKFARVCVEVDLMKPLLSKYKIEGVEYLIQYEGLENICTDCGTYGRPTNHCHCKNPIEVVAESVEMVPETQDVEPEKGPVYGDWMMVKRRDRRMQKRGNGFGSKGDIQKRMGNMDEEHNRFEVLGDETQTDKPAEVERNMYRTPGKKHEEVTRRKVTQRTNIEETTSTSHAKQVNNKEAQKVDTSKGEEQNIVGQGRGLTTKKSNMPIGKGNEVAPQQNHGKNPAPKQSILKQGGKLGKESNREKFREGDGGRNNIPQRNGAGSPSPLGHR
ncbi:unnamed protein product [Linum tenue]|nr:unnamed protein product [Linum tenue]